MTDDTNIAYEEKEEESTITASMLLRTFLQQWKWFAAAVVVFVAAAACYLRYTMPVYRVEARVLIKDDNGGRRNRSSQQLQAFGIMNQTDGFDNELEVLKSLSLVKEAIVDTKQYVSYTTKGHIAKTPVANKSLPALVDFEAQRLDSLRYPVALSIKYEGGAFIVKGRYEYQKLGMEEPAHRTFERTGRLPMTFRTAVGTVTIRPNGIYTQYASEGYELRAVINSPEVLAPHFARSMKIAATSETTTIAGLSKDDAVPERAKDFLTALVVAYNRQANLDKNEIALRTEQFINQRIAKISDELGSTDSRIEGYKRDNNILEPVKKAELSLKSTDEVDNRLAEMNTQILLMQSIKEYTQQPANRYQTLPSNVGLNDQAATSLIAQYNTLALERKRLMRSASELSPAVQTITQQLDDLTNSINRAIDQARRSLEIERRQVANRYQMYTGQLQQSPEQERVLTQIGRQQTVMSGLYLMLLQKREDNSITLAATADKGKLIDEPALTKKVKPMSSVILLVAFVLGIVLPFVFFIVREKLRYRINGRDDVKKLLPGCPIVADIPVANKAAMTKGDIIVHENTNNRMTEVFRALRTNLQFIFKDKQNVVMFTSTISGEGKTFIACNLAVSFSLLGKRVVVVGLDIRRPRLSDLFQLNDHGHGITPLLTHDDITPAMVREQIIPSGINKNLDLLPAGVVPPNPSELLSRKSLGDVFDILRQEYDYVIVDTAPIGLVTDTLEVARRIDVSVIVTRDDYTEKAALNTIQEYITTGKLTGVAVALNGIDFTKKEYGKYGHYGQYGHYGKYGKYGHYGNYGNYGIANDNSVKEK